MLNSVKNASWGVELADKLNDLARMLDLFIVTDQHEVEGC